MKTLKFNTDSWHWYLASELGNYMPHRHGDDLCAYTRRVILGSIKMIGFLAVMGVLIAAVGFLFWNIVFGIIFSIMTHSWFFTDFGEGGLFVIAFFASLAGLFGLFKLIAYGLSRGVDAAKSATIEKPDSFAFNAYNAWHDKFCAKLEFDYGEDDK